MKPEKITVAGKRFNLLLKGLLPRNAPFISIKTAALRQSSVIFLDAREPAEFDVSHLPGALPVGYKNFTLASVAGIATTQKIVVYCSVGWRSGHIANQLIAAGYTSVHNLYGGLFEWCNAGHPLYRQGIQVRQVHVYAALWARWVTAAVEKVY